MKNKIVLIVASAIALAANGGSARLPIETANPQAHVGKKMPTENQKESEVPFACNLTALTAAQREHHAQLSKELRASVKDLRELTEGYAFRLDGDVHNLATVAEWISLERRCCPFFKFQIEIESEGKPIWLRITGREGVKKFIRLEFGIH